jgi:hypothetical protein
LLKHEVSAATQLYEKMSKLSSSVKHIKTIQENLDAAVTYFHNHLHQMNYSDYRDKNYPIGSGVTEAACKTVIKQRFCCSGMRWKEIRCCRDIEFKNFGFNTTKVEPILG